MMTSSNYRAKAREKLAGRWTSAVLIFVAYFLISFVFNFIEGLLPETLATIFSIIISIIEVPLSFGLIIAFFKFFNNEKVKSFDFLSLGFSNFKKSWGISLRITLKLIIPIILIIVGLSLLTFGVATYSAITGVYSSSIGGFAILGLILYIIGLVWGIVQSYNYQLAYIIAADDETLTSKEVIEKSKNVMQNKRWKLFCLQISFFGWMILAGLTLGIGLFWLIPYMQGSMIEFAKDALGNNNQNPSIDENVDPIQ